VATGLTNKEVAGTGLQPYGLVITSFPTLPAATQGAPYQNTLLAVGGTPPFRWAFTGGNKVQGLSLAASSGRISGTVASTVKVGNYSSKVQVTDSSTPPKTATAVVTIPVGAPTGSNCNNISINVAGTQTPAVALNDLGTGNYQGYEGGACTPTAQTLTLQATRLRPWPLPRRSSHAMQTAIPTPPNGAYALIALGVSVTEQPFIDFINVAGADPAKKSHLVLVNGGPEQLSKRLLGYHSSVRGALRGLYTAAGCRRMGQYCRFHRKRTNPVGVDEACPKALGDPYGVDVQAFRRLKSAAIHRVPPSGNGIRAAPAVRLPPPAANSADGEFTGWAGQRLTCANPGTYGCRERRLDAVPS
jgi:hypothetical protein